MPQDRISEIIERKNPHKWWQRKRIPTPLEIAAAQLEECQRDQLDHSTNAEYHAAMGKMLKEREKRLLREINTMTQPQHDPLDSQPG